MKRMIVVVGVPRSGTSLCCQALERLGVSFGGPLIEGDSANPWGYYEHRELMEQATLFVMRRCGDPVWFKPEPLFANSYATAEPLLDALKAELANHALFGWKTPLAGRLDAAGEQKIFTWICNDAGAEPVFVHALRDPDAVFTSTILANGGSQKLAYKDFLLTWARMVTECRDLCPVHELWYEDWREDPQKTLDKLADALQLPHANASGLLKE